MKNCFKFRITPLKFTKVLHFTNEKTEEINCPRSLESKRPRQIQAPKSDSKFNALNCSFILFLLSKKIQSLNHFTDEENKDPLDQDICPKLH